MSSSTRVIKNTLYLYIKMGITMIVSLFSTRLVLASLGASDFGVFNVVGGAIAMLGFLNSTMANATQRFMAFTEGEGGAHKKIAVFNVCFILHIVIAIITAVFLIAAMYPLFNGVFNIESGRETAAVSVYVSLIVSTILTIINVPYDAVMNAHENMLFYSIIGILESLLKLAVAFICVNTTKDKLIIYGVLMSCIPIVTLSIMKVYCHHHYEECVISPRRYWDGTLLKQIFGFFGWNFLTAITSLFSIQGVNILLNHFFGTLLNAAQGIANQVNGALSQFSENMKKALNPVITKNAGSKNISAMNKAAAAGCKFSSLLTMLFAIPVCLEIKYILSLWLKEVPDWAALFVVLQLIQSVILQMCSSAATAIYAQGEIKNYAIWKGAMNIMPIIFTWLAFKMGCGPIWLYIPMIVFWGIAGDGVILYYAKKQCGVEVKSYIKDVVSPVAATALIMLFLGYLSVTIMAECFVRLIITSIVTSFGMFLSGCFFALTKDEKKQFVDFISRIFFF